MLCAKLGHWPFPQGSARATAAQVTLFASVWLDMQPKAPQRSKPVDDMTWGEWQGMFTNGPA